MEHNHLPAHIQEWMKKIEECVVSDPALLQEYCDKLEQYAEENHSDYLKGYSLFFRGFCCYTQAKLEESMSALSSALNYLINAEDWFMTARTYNSMGNIADFQGDMSLAIDCYCKGLVISKEHDLGLLTYSISSNIGNIHLSLGQLDHAAEMFFFCERLVEEGLEVPLHYQLVIHANLATCCVRLGELEKARLYADKLVRDSGDTPSETDRVILRILITDLSHALGDTDARDAAIAELSSMALPSSTVFDALNELCRHARLLLELDKLEEFRSLISNIAVNAESPHVKKMVLDLYMQYYRKIGDDVNLARTAVEFYEVSELREDMRNLIVSHNILTRVHLDEESVKREETERMNLMLKQRSERDPLTGMNNRYKLNELSELAFHRAYTSGSPLTVEILDIDCYKEFNDNYGHQAGDRCLVRIADAIRSMEEYPNVYTARYGGDEFVIIYEGYSLKDVEKMAKLLQDKIYLLNIEHKFSSVSDRVTVSQGLFQRIPAGGNKPWDFLHYADKALYGVKRRTKNAFYIGTRTREVEAYSKPE